MEVTDYVLLRNGRYGQICELFKDGKAVIKFVQNDDSVSFKTMSLKGAKKIMPVVITQADLKALIRYEITFIDLIKDPVLKDNCEIEKSYFPTLDDLKTMLVNIRNREETYAFLKAYWLDYIINNEKVYNALHLHDIAEFSSVLLPLNEEELMNHIYHYLTRGVSKEHENDLAYHVICANDLLEDIGYYQREKDEFILDRHFSLEIMRNFLSYIEKYETLEEQDPIDRLLYKKFVDILIENDDLFALHLKAYATYGGNEIYPCDYKEAERCLLKAFEISPNPLYANSLGFIYYAGRSTNGVPAYDKAYKYFSIASLSGYIESTYKLGDMFFLGLEVPKMPATAKNLYDQCYTRSLGLFVFEDFGCSLADIALRLGNYYTLEEYEDIEKAYYYYLMAKCAIKKRIRFAKQYGDETLYNEIITIVEDTAVLYHQIKKPASIITHSLMALNDFVFFDHPLRLTLSFNTNSRPKMVIQSDVSVGGKDLKLLHIEPLADYSELVDEVIYTIEGYNGHHLNGGNSVSFDSVMYEGSMYVFYDHHTEVGYINCDSMIWRAKKQAKKSLIRMATVSFGKDGHTYDYICNDTSILVSDIVVVESYQGEVEAEVVNIYEREEDDLAFALADYQSVLYRKMNDLN